MSRTNYYSPTLTRLYEILVEHADANGDVQLTQRQLAGLTGLTTTLVSQAMGLLRAEGSVVSRPPNHDEARAAALGGYGAAWVHRVYVVPEHQRRGLTVLDGGAR